MHGPGAAVLIPLHHTGTLQVSKMWRRRLRHTIKRWTPNSQHFLQHWHLNLPFPQAPIFCCPWCWEEEWFTNSLKHFRLGLFSWTFFSDKPALFSPPSSSSKVKAAFNEKTKCYEIRTLSGCQKYKEVFICYGPHDNQRLLLEYGFVANSNPHSSVHVGTGKFEIWSWHWWVMQFYWRLRTANLPLSGRSL